MSQSPGSLQHGRYPWLAHLLPHLDLFNTQDLQIDFQIFLAPSLPLLPSCLQCPISSLQHLPCRPITAPQLTIPTPKRSSFRTLGTGCKAHHKGSWLPPQPHPDATSMPPPQLQYCRLSAPHCLGQTLNSSKHSLVFFPSLHSLVGYLGSLPFIPRKGLFFCVFFF